MTPLPPDAAIGAFVALGTRALRPGAPEFDLSQQWFAHALQVAREAGDVAAEASVCQSLAGVAGKMGDGAAAAQAAEMALGLRRAKLEEAGRTLVAAEEALAAFTVTVTQSQAPPSVGTEDAADPTPQPGSEAIGVAPATGGRPATAPPITSPDHARAFGAAAAAKRALAEARRAEVAALANVGAALLKVPATSGLASGAAEASEASSEDAPLGTDVASKTEDAGDAPRDPSPATRVAAGVARYEEALASLRRDAAGPQDLEMEIGLLLELANAHDNRVGGDAGRARARLARASLRAAVKALTANQREFPNTCTLCSETMDVIENEGEVDRGVDDGFGPGRRRGDATGDVPGVPARLPLGVSPALARREAGRGDGRRWRKRRGREKTSPGGNRRSRGVPTAPKYTRAAPPPPRRRRDSRGAPRALPGVPCREARFRRRDGEARFRRRDREADSTYTRECVIGSRRTRIRGHLLLYNIIMYLISTTTSRA